MKRQKTVFERIAQKNRLFARLAGPGSHKTTDRQKRRILRVLFP